MMIFSEDMSAEDEQVLKELGKTKILHTKDGFFAVVDGKPVTLSQKVQRALHRKYEDQKRKKDYADRDLKDANKRYEFRSKTLGDTLFRSKVSDKKKFVADDTREHYRKINQRGAYDHAYSQETKSLIEKFKKEVKQLVPNLLKPEFQLGVVDTFERGNSTELLAGSNMRLPQKALGTSARKKIVGKKNTTKPLLLFFYDRSGSFSPDSEATRWKTQLGNDLVDAFKEITRKDEFGEIDVKYMSTDIFDDEKTALSKVTNDPDKCCESIEKIIDGRVANVVILTDTDSDAMKRKLNVDGIVWWIYAYDYGRKPKFTASRKIVSSHGAKYNKLYEFQGN